MVKVTRFCRQHSLLRTLFIAPIRSNITLLRAGILVLSLLMIGSTVSADDHLSPAVADDGWRRTIDGWEQRASWKLSASELRIKVPGEITASVFKPEWDRYALHPAALSAALLLLAWSGLHIAAWRPINR